MCFQGEQEKGAAGGTGGERSGGFGRGAGRGRQPREPTVVTRPSPTFDKTGS